MQVRWYRGRLVFISLFLLYFSQSKGELTSEREEENEKAQKNYEKLVASISTLSVSLSLLRCTEFYYVFLAGCFGSRFSRLA